MTTGLIPLPPLFQHGNAFDWFIATLEATGSVSHDRRTWQCPAHLDERPSLSVAAGNDQAVVLHDFGGCTTGAVLLALGLRLRHLFTPPPVRPALWAATVCPDLTYPPARSSPRYSADRGSLHLDAIHSYGTGYRLLRWRTPSGHKDLRWERRDPAGAWLPGLGPGVHTADLPLYQADQLPMAIGAGETIWIVESESSVDALMRSGRYACTWAGGAADPPLEKLSTVLAGSVAIMVADHDQSGIACAQRVAQALDCPALIPATAGHDVRDVLADDPGLATLSELDVPRPAVAATVERKKPKKRKKVPAYTHLVPPLYGTDTPAPDSPSTEADQFPPAISATRAGSASNGRAEATTVPAEIDPGNTPVTNYAAEYVHGPLGPADTAWWLATYTPKVARILADSGPLPVPEIADRIGDVTPGLIDVIARAAPHVFTHTRRFNRPDVLSLAGREGAAQLRPTTNTNNAERNPR